MQHCQDTLLGINTYRSYHAVLNAIREQGLDVDLIVATGDLVQDQTVEAYQCFTLISRYVNVFL